MQTFWKVAFGAAIVAALGAGSAGAVAMTSALTITDEPGLVQRIDPVSTDSDSSTTDADTTPKIAPTPTPTSTATADVPVAPPVAVPPAGSQNIDDDDVDEIDVVDNVDNVDNADNDVDDVDEVDDVDDVDVDVDDD
ncbi:hypothetical protein E3T46_17285 [Cryobacterium sp. Hh11]|uniref:hypothetical protein n=1 Tax=Cryobacterium sp. Hh11 TaxID=2555868 RepID=UPI00106ACF87|nr:hypothetical protein [Cryobacterium sp. Hh11]TFD47551.1 hypothetical protein E3T46_17285 [Cryobacterium sp. Hh11]